MRSRVTSPKGIGCVRRGDEPRRSPHPILKAGTILNLDGGFAARILGSITFCEMRYTSLDWRWITLSSTFGGCCLTRDDCEERARRVRPITTMWPWRLSLPLNYQHWKVWACE